MKGTWSAEAIGWGGRNSQRRRRMRSLAYEDLRPWVARITGLSARYGYRREFLDHKTTYLRASSSGDRGVEFWWTLEPGEMYEARRPVSWTRMERLFLTVTDGGEVIEVSRQEVDRWVRARFNVGSASTS